jgi:hypothetical protein
MDTGAVDSPYPPYSWWYSVHVGSAYRDRCPPLAPPPPVRVSGYPRRRRLRGGFLHLVLQSLVGTTVKLAVSFDFLKQTCLDGEMNAYYVLSSTRKSTREACSTAGVRDQISLHQSPRNFHQSAYSVGVRGPHKDLWYGPDTLAPNLLPHRPQGTYTDNTMIYFDYSSMAAFLPKRIISF